MINFYRRISHIVKLHIGFFVSEIICRQRCRVVKAPSREQQGLGSKLTHAILLFPWLRHFTTHSPAWWSWQAVLSYSHISIKLQADSNIMVFPEEGRGNWLPYVLAFPSLSCESGG